VNAFFAGDSMQFLDDKLKIDLGLKQVFVSRDGTNETPGPQYGVSVDSRETLPRASARYQIDDVNQVFFKVSTNFRTPVESVLYNSYSIYDSSLQTNASTHVKDEYSISEEVGWRYQSDVVVGSLTFFNYDFSNRQVQDEVSINGVLVGSSVNAGGQTSRGVDAEAGLVPWHHFAPYVSFEYLDATLDNNFQTTGNIGTTAKPIYVTDYLPTAGKTAVRSPDVVASASVTYDDGTYFGTLTGKYTGSEYSTFLNDQKIPGYATADITVGYRFPSLWYLKHPEVRLNLTNITDNSYLSGIASPTANANNTRGIDGSKIAGTSPTYYIGPGFAAMITLSTAF
jgi:outer membrane receptor protein involved in Fe transport